jgi:hypothetical protein
MTAYLTIIQYPRFRSFGGLLSMLFFRLPLAMNKKVSFYKLMGTGKSGGFDKRPNWGQWCILIIHENDEIQGQSSITIINNLFKPFITKWLAFFKCHLTMYILDPVSCHGQWDNKEIFGKLPQTNSLSGQVAILTRATIRLSKLSSFWKHVPSVASQMASAAGLSKTYGMGEIPLIKQATFSIWENMEYMKAFAYTTYPHRDVILKTRKEGWYSEEMFARFRILRTLELQA